MGIAQLRGCTVVWMRGCSGQTVVLHMGNSPEFMPEFV